MNYETHGRISMLIHGSIHLYKANDSYEKTFATQFTPTWVCPGIFVKKTENPNVREIQLRLILGDVKF